MLPAPASVSYRPLRAGAGGGSSRWPAGRRLRGRGGESRDIPRIGRAARRGLSGLAASTSATFVAPARPRPPRWSWSAWLRASRWGDDDVALRSPPPHRCGDGRWPPPAPGGWGAATSPWVLARRRSPGSAAARRQAAAGLLVFGVRPPGGAGVDLVPGAALVRPDDVGLALGLALTARPPGRGPAPARAGPRAGALGAPGRRRPADLPGAPAGADPLSPPAPTLAGIDVSWAEAPRSGRPGRRPRWSC